jgi:hypothetical protein
MNDLSDNNLNTLLNSISYNENEEKNKPWNKLDNSTKIQKLHIFAENFGKDKKFSVKEIKLLKTYFKDCILHKNKLNKSKDIVYDKDTGIITTIPGLNYNQHSKSFTIRVNDNKRVSTLKSLAPKRKTPKKDI